MTNPATAENNRIEALFEQRSKITWPKPSLAIVYGALLGVADSNSFLTPEGKLAILVNMRQIKSLTGLGHSCTELAALVRELEELGYIRVVNMIKDSRDSMIELTQKPHKGLTRFLHSETQFPRSRFLTQKPYKEALSNIDKYKEVTVPNVLNIRNIDYIDNIDDISNYYTLIYNVLCKGILCKDNESLLGYSKLNPTQKWVLELICTHLLSLEDLRGLLGGVRKNNLKSRVLKPLGDYVVVEDGVLVPRDGVLGVLEASFDRERSDTIHRAIEDDRNKYCEQQREYRAAEDNKTFNYIVDFQKRKQEKRDASVPILAHQDTSEGVDPDRCEGLDREQGGVSEKYPDGVADGEQVHGSVSNGQEHWDGRVDCTWESTYGKQSRLYVPHAEREESEVFDMEKAPTQEEVFRALDDLVLPDFTDCDEPEEALEEKPHTSPIEEAVDETYFNSLCEEIGALDLEDSEKAANSSVTTEVAQTLLANPSILRQEFINGMWSDTQKKAPGLADLTYPGFREALIVLVNKTSFGAFADRQRKEHVACT